MDDDASTICMSIRGWCFFLYREKGWWREEERAVVSLNLQKWEVISFFNVIFYALLNTFFRIPATLFSSSALLCVQFDVGLGG